jgi:hypothetical protein
MFTTVDAVYCIRGTRACQTHRTSRKSFEADINAQLAALTGNCPALNEAVIVGIWGSESLAGIECGCDWNHRRVTSSGKGADWKLQCDCAGSPLLLAEHKPRGAVAHWKRTPIAAFMSKAVDHAGHGEVMRWLEELDAACDTTHTREDCRRNHPRCSKDTDEKINIAGPQILSDAFDTGTGQITAVTVLTDKCHRNGSSMGVDDVWDTQGLEEYPLFLNGDFFPIRSTPMVLNDLSAVIAHRLDELDAEQRATLRAVVEAMWMRAGGPEVSLKTASLMRHDVLHDCLHDFDHGSVAWADFEEWEVLPPV